MTATWVSPRCSTVSRAASPCWGARLAMPRKARRWPRFSWAAARPTWAQGPQLILIAGKPIEEGVGGSVVALASRSQQGGSRGEEHEEVQIQVQGQPMQMPGAAQLGGEHLGKVVPVLMDEQAIGEHAGGMEDPAQGGGSLCDAGEQGSDLVFVGHIE